MIDLRNSINDALATLSMENPDRDFKVKIDIDKQTLVIADDFITDIWLNLFRNIAKFDKEKKCRIEISAKKNEV